MTTPQHSMVTLRVGDIAPQFSLPAHPSGTISLNDFIGKKNVILAFYPKDDTPGCTKEMCAFSADLDKFNSAGTQVLGISCDNSESHEKFAQKHNLTVPLLDDSARKVGEAYGTVREDKATAERMLFVIDKEGVIRHIHNGIHRSKARLTRR
jgi:thioredoxin-dependent peroxiredoxin